MYNCENCISTSWEHKMCCEFVGKHVLRHDAILTKQGHKWLN